MECITKQEAIEWIKSKDNLYGSNYPCDIVEFLKEKLNISEEDLN